ncbi:hypothetical protein M9H77_37067 [Catharanthus roseus]|uniref:Uncharacterized protein n=1 Tax=Catharanthus roseus TaxID=4058 RepID=A0ACB9ZXV0_CATRO|nr:hypothetical protein M9H77_37067 [Catharanthus roseus]
MKEIIQASCLHGMLHFRLPPLSASALNHKCRLSGALPSLALSISEPNIACRNCRTTAICNSSLLDDAASDSAPTVVPQVDPSLPVKNRAAEISPGLKGTSVFLVGINSSMKSNLGKVLADTLRYYYFDSDTLVEEAAGGKSSAKLLIKMDERGFRDSETEVLKQLSSMGRLVVSAGNGAVQCATNLALLRHGISIWIDVPLEMVAREIVDETIQLPASESEISGSYSEVLNQLTKKYEESRNEYATADSTVSIQKVASTLGYEDLDAVTVEDMALEVLKELEKLTRLKKMMEEAARPF